MKKLQDRLRPQTANLITLTRFFFSGLVFIDMTSCFEGNRQKLAAIALWTFVICISDFMDGRVARRMNISSRFGANLDFIADCFYIWGTFFILWKWGIMTLWFLVLATEKFVNYLVTSYVYQKKKGDAFAYIKDPIGRHMAAFYFVVPSICIIVYCCIPRLLWTLTALQVILSVLGVMSSLLRVIRTWGYPKKRELGIANGKYVIPDDIDADNDEISEIFRVE